MLATEHTIGGGGGGEGGWGGTGDGGDGGGKWMVLVSVISTSFTGVSTFVRSLLGWQK